MKIDEQLIRAVTAAVVEQLQKNGQLHLDIVRDTTNNKKAIDAPAGRTRMKPKHSYKDTVKAEQGTDPKEIVIGVGAAFQTEIRSTICGIPLDKVLQNVQAGIEEEGHGFQCCKGSGHFRRWIYGTSGCQAFRFRDWYRNPVKRYHCDPSKGSISLI